MRNTLVPLLPKAPDPANWWVNAPWTGEWPFALSRKGCKEKPGNEKKGRAQGWRENAGCIECRRHVVLVIRGATQLACRLKNVGNPSRTWLLRATRSSDESRFPFAKRRSELTTTRRVVRGGPGDPKSVD